MTHCYTDFLLLCALGTARKNEALADALTNTDALLCGCLTEDTLIHGLTVLQNEGYISLPGGEADADTVCLLTAKGRQAIAVPVLSRLFGRRDAALFAREDAFLAAPAGNGETTVVLRPGAFDTVRSRLLRAAGANGDYDGAPWITVARCEGGMAVTLRVPGAALSVAVTATVADRMTAQPRRTPSPCPIPSGRFTRTGCLPGVSRICCWQCGTFSAASRRCARRRCLPAPTCTPFR